MTSGPRGSRTKGHAYELEVAAALREHWPEARRGLQYQDGSTCPDVVGVDGWHIECKRRKVVAWSHVLGALEQAEADAAEGQRPVAIMRKDRCPPVVCMSWETWVEIARELTDGK